MTNPTPDTIMVIDNYDSFVYTIVGYLEQLGARCVVHQADQVPLGEITHGRVAGVLVSPGPGTPSDAGQSLSAIASCVATKTPMFGVCLGHQCLAEYFGGITVHAPEIMHGRTSPISHDGAGVFAGVGADITVTRYHSLVVDPVSVKYPLDVTAKTADGVIMGLRHRDLPLESVQFHPESVLSQRGHLLFANWLHQCGYDAPEVLLSKAVRPLGG